MIDVVCWLWKPEPTYRSQYAQEHVNILRRMVARHYPHPHRFSCITDYTEGFDDEVRLIPLWSDHRNRPSIYGPGTPSCYPRLRAFSPEMRDIIGPRFVSIDLDALVVGDLTPVFNRPEDFLIWGASQRRTPWNGSLWMMDAGARAQVWTRFNENPERAVLKARGAGFYGSDQAWMNYVLGKHENHWNEKDGVFSYRMHIREHGGDMPRGARIIFFEGRHNPWDAAVLKTSPWVAQHYR